MQRNNNLFYSTPLASPDFRPQIPNHFKKKTYRNTFIFGTFFYTSLEEGKINFSKNFKRV